MKISGESFRIVATDTVSCGLPLTFLRIKPSHKGKWWLFKVAQKIRIEDKPVIADDLVGMSEKFRRGRIFINTYLSLKVK